MNYSELFKSKIIVLVEIQNDKDAYDLASCLVDSGVINIEVALRTPNSKKAAEIIKKNFPKINLGLGTITSKEDVDFAINLSSKFCFAPDCNPKILEECNQNKLFFIPGVRNLEEIKLARRYGYNVLKFFPAESLGGIKKLELLNQKVLDNNLSFIPSGGINESNMNSYLNKSFVKAVAGSWIAPKEIIASRNWNEISHRAKISLNSI
jgi:Entner-Doudoroff aldolase